MRQILSGGLFIVGCMLFAGLGYSHNKDMHQSKQVAVFPSISAPIESTWLPAPRRSLPKGKKVTHHSGKKVDLSSDAPLSIVFFGFTHCPDVCPLTLRKIKAAIGKMEEPKAKDVRVVFFSIDPENDTMASMKSYVEPLGNQFEAVLPTREVLDPTLKNMAAYSRKIGGVLSHTELLYFIDKQGNWTGFTRVPKKAEELSVLLSGALARSIEIARK